MPYQKTIWKNREVEKPRTVRVQNNPDGTVTLLPAEGNIIEAGTPIIAENMNKIEDAVAAVDDTLTQHLDENAAHVPYANDTGTANAKVVSIPNVTSYFEGMGVSFKNLIQNTGAVTLNVNGYGAKSILKSNGSPLTSGNLKVNSIYTVRYNGTNFILQGEGGSGNAVASDLLSGKTASTDAGDIVGTMPNRGTFNLGLGVTVPHGYYSGGTTASGKRFAEGTLVSQNGTNSIPVGFNIGSAVATRVINGALNGESVAFRTKLNGNNRDVYFNDNNSSVLYILEGLGNSILKIQCGGQGLSIYWKVYEL